MQGAVRLCLRPPLRTAGNDRRPVGGHAAAAARRRQAGSRASHADGRGAGGGGVPRRPRIRRGARQHGHSHPPRRARFGGAARHRHGAAGAAAPRYRRTWRGAASARYPFRRQPRTLGAAHGQTQHCRPHAAGRHARRGGSGRTQLTAIWTIGGLLRAMAERGPAEAVVQMGDDSVGRWDHAALAGKAASLARGLRTRFAGATGTRVGLYAPNSPEWVAASLGILAAGAVLVPLDDLADLPEALPMLAASGVRILLASAAHAAADAQRLRELGIEVIVLGPQASACAGTESWETVMAGGGADLPPIDPEAPAAVLATSGTTSAPKTFLLSHRNIGANVTALLGLNLVGPEDRILLPLPLHHAYPLVVGMLTTLAAGSALVLPSGAGGPAIMRAAREGAISVIVGVPRLYDAIAGAIDARIAARPWPVRIIARSALWISGLVRRATGLSIGPMLFRPVRHAVSPALRLMVSGGARLEPATERRLEDLGWTVLSGYGLAETASIFTGNRPERRRFGSAGQPIGDGEIRIADPGTDGVGEIQLRGASVTPGYIDNPAANEAGFTRDGWFRTGDLGFIDRNGFLFVTGRAREVLVLGGGKKVNPEDLERVYGAAPQIQEIAVLEMDGALAALVRPDYAKIHAMGTVNIREGIRIVLAERAQPLSPYQRLAGFAVTDEPLPRTRMGKYRRFLLRDLYRRAASGAPAREARAPTEADQVLLAAPAAARAWALLRARHAGPIDLDMSPSLDMNFDSFTWMELTVALQEQCGIRLTESDIAAVTRLRDLFRIIAEREGAAPFEAGKPPLAADTERWLAPAGVLLTAVGVFFYVLNLLIMRLCFRLTVRGLEHLPPAGPYVITPNHVSDLDAMAIAAALPLSRLRQVYWAGDIVRLFYNAASRLFCRAVHLFPVDERFPSAAVDTAARVLAAGKVQVWFPEGWRAPDGRLQRFLPGVAQLLIRSGAPAVPAYLDGAFEALPRGHRIPRFRRITLVFGPPARAALLAQERDGATAEERVSAALRRRVIMLATDAGFTVTTIDRPGMTG
ncbi:MAG: AMP-binding protein [Proteobacteria bacterium]|nr:AMP-binding protein [Pseudomonadota bacterium]